MPNKTFLSIILPTRKRTKLVERSLQSLLEKAKNPEQIEIVIAYDDDDGESKEYFQGPNWQNFVNGFSSQQQVFETPRWGYEHLHNYVNFLAEKSRGQWILFWNDDALMLTRDWDYQVYLNRNHLGLIHMPCTNTAKHTLFPLFPKLWIDIFGCVSLSNHNDSWLQDICRSANAVQDIPVEVFHDRFSETGNNNDEVFADRRYTKKLYKSDAMRAIREQWTQRLIAYRESNKTAHVSPALAAT